jgi:hypothetical protein
MLPSLPLDAYEAANQSPPYVDVDLYGSDRPTRHCRARPGNPSFCEEDGPPELGSTQVRAF